ncbi:hypothetical protein [uncultured Anaerococcus sp.]|uniref:hypothetical protein n=1 Tax=uncultured Anaerococcus sp. TaxID=293428 RepID=UPI002806361C|nr:hypothetical protein [uncultured Anaerococcus sp.]
MAKIKKLEKQSPLLSIIDTINTLVDRVNDLEPVIDSLRALEDPLNESLSPDKVHQKTIEIKTSGLYEISIERGFLQVYTSYLDGDRKLRYQLNKEHKSQEIALCNGDRLFFLVEGMELENKINIRLKENMVDCFRRLADAVNKENSINQ